jgi:hypothetical protein
MKLSLIKIIIPSSYPMIYSFVHGASGIIIFPQLVLLPAPFHVPIVHAVPPLFWLPPSAPPPTCVLPGLCMRLQPIFCTIN